MPPDKPAANQYPESPVSVLQTWSWLTSFKDNQLLPKTEILSNQLSSRFETRRYGECQPSNHLGLLLVIVLNGVFHMMQCLTMVIDKVFAPYNHWQTQTAYLELVSGKKGLLIRIV